MALLGLASWTNGDLAEAHRAYSESMAMMLRFGHASDVLACAIAVADLELAQGRLSDAKRTYERALELIATQGAAGVRGTADMHVGLSSVLLERNDQQGAAEFLLRSKELNDHAGLPQNPYRFRVAMAHLRHAEGDLDGADALLKEAQRVYTGDYSPNVRPIPALRARLHLAQGRMADAAAWVRDCGVTVDDELSYLREFEHITLARVLLAQYAHEQRQPALAAATRLLERLLVAAEQGGRTRNVIEILLLTAHAQQAGGDMATAFAALQRALAMGEPEGYVRVFLDEGTPVVSLLTALAKQDRSERYARQLLNAVDTNGDHTSSGQRLVDPLSSRELDVLRLLATDLTGPDIARELVVSLSTVRSHTKSIYVKLGVNSRRAAVRLAKELNLFAGASKG
jgi:LuxR family maltose regulon positive regulatory protein